MDLHLVYSYIKPPYCSYSMTISHTRPGGRPVYVFLVLNVHHRLGMGRRLFVGNHIKPQITAIFNLNDLCRSDFFLTFVGHCCNLENNLCINQNHFIGYQ